MRPSYNFEKIRFATDGPTLKRAIELYETGKVKEFEEVLSGYSAIVLGTKPYHVYVSARGVNFEDAKHMREQIEQEIAHSRIPSFELPVE